MKGFLKTAAKWIGGIVALLVFLGWAESSGAEPVEKWQLVVLLAYITFVWYSISARLDDLQSRVNLLIERGNPPSFHDATR